MWNRTDTIRLSVCDLKEDLEKLGDKVRDIKFAINGGGYLGYTLGLEKRIDDLETEVWKRCKTCRRVKT